MEMIPNVSMRFIYVYKTISLEMVWCIISRDFCITAPRCAWRKKACVMTQRGGPLPPLTHRSMRTIERHRLNAICVELIKNNEESWRTKQPGLYHRQVICGIKITRYWLPAWIFWSLLKRVIYTLIELWLTWIWLKNIALWYNLELNIVNDRFSTK